MPTLAALATGPASDRLPTAYKEALAKRWGYANGFKGFVGGWIFNVLAPGCPTVCQGWSSFWSIKRTQILDDLTKRHTAFSSFAELVQTDERYTPALLVLSGKDWQVDALACAFDEAMAGRKSLRRAHRGKGRDVRDAAARLTADERRDAWRTRVFDGVVGW